MTKLEYMTALNDIQEAYLNWRIDYAEFKRLSEELLAEYEQPTQAE